MNRAHAWGLNLFCAALSFALAGAAGAKTLTVTGSGEPATIGSASCPANTCPTLRDAVNAAVSGDTITFAGALNGSTIALTLASNDTNSGSIQFGASAFVITDGLGETVGKSLTIDGAGHGITIARSGVAAFRLFDVAPLSSLTLRGLTLRKGFARGGSSNSGGGALGAGGAIFNQGIVTIESCTFAANAAQGGSGGRSTPPFSSSAGGGGGVGQDATTFDGGGPNGGASGMPPRNGGFGGGGGTSLDTVNDPGANGGFGGGGGKGGGGIGGGNGGFGGAGGGDSLLPGIGGFGAGLAAGDPDHVPAGGGGGGMGGAIFNDAGTMTIVNTTFYANTATGGNTLYGGGPGAGGNGSGLGGAIFNYAGTLNLSFATVSGNTTSTGTGGDGGSADGGAIYSYGDANCGGNDGNTCSSGDANLVLVNSIAFNNPGSAHDVVIDHAVAGASISSGGGNLIGTHSAFAGTFISGNPKLGPLSANALAPATLPIPASSAAYNAAGSCLDAKSQVVSVDERGKARPQAGICDIGAYEFDNDYIFANGFE
jgi:hypothetical protein